MATAVARLTNAPEPIRAARPEVSRPSRTSSRAASPAIPNTGTVRARARRRARSGTRHGADRPAPPPVPGAPTVATALRPVTDAVAPGPPRPAPPHPEPPARRGRRWPWSCCSCSSWSPAGSGRSRSSNLTSDDSGGGGNGAASEQRRRAADRRGVRTSTRSATGARAQQRGAARDRQRSRRRYGRGSSYNTREFGNAKPGVGWSSSSSATRHLGGRVDALEGGLERRRSTSRIIAADTSTAGARRARSGETSPATHHGRARRRDGPVVLVWFTHLPPSNKLQIGDIKVEGR